MDNQSGAEFAQQRAAGAEGGESAMAGNDELKAMIRQVVMEVLQEMQSGAQV